MNYEAKALSQSHQAIIPICYDQKKYFHWLWYRKSLYPYLCVCIIVFLCTTQGMV